MTDVTPLQRLHEQSEGGTLDTQVQALELTQT